MVLGTPGTPADADEGTNEESALQQFNRLSLNDVGILSIQKQVADRINTILFEDEIIVDRTVAPRAFQKLMYQNHSTLVHEPGIVNLQQAVDFLLHNTQEQTKQKIRRAIAQVMEHPDSKAVLIDNNLIPPNVLISTAAPSAPGPLASTNPVTDPPAAEPTPTKKSYLKSARDRLPDAPAWIKSPWEWVSASVEPNRSWGKWAIDWVNPMAWYRNTPVSKGFSHINNAVGPTKGAIWKPLNWGLTHGPLGWINVFSNKSILASSHENS